MTFLPDGLQVLLPGKAGPLGASSNLTSGTAYFTFLQFCPIPVTVQFVYVFQPGGGAGAQTAEIGLFSTPAPPNKANQSLSKIVATGALSGLATGSNQHIRNTGAFAQVVPAGTYLWAGIRVAMATTQPTLEGFICDGQEGWVLTTAAAGALTGAGPFAGVVPTTAIGGGTASQQAVMGVDLRAELV